MEKDRFEQLVVQAVEELPEQFREKLENIDVVVEDWPSNRQIKTSGLGKGFTLLGLYEGVPLTLRSSSYGLVPPDKITIFKE
jgi:predicted Zn-dependent protease with MMP-like domain